MLLPQNLDSLSLGNSSYSIPTWIKSRKRTDELKIQKEESSEKRTKFVQQTQRVKMIIMWTPLGKTLLSNSLMPVCVCALRISSKQWVNEPLQRAQTQQEEPEVFSKRTEEAEESLMPNTLSLLLSVVLVLLWYIWWVTLEVWEIRLTSKRGWQFQEQLDERSRGKCKAKQSGWNVASELQLTGLEPQCLRPWADPSTLEVMYRRETLLSRIL